jgi:polysaccharide pyruvyl transferase WcaK-like protein
MLRSHKERKVAVLGWYGHNNLGDTLILQGICRLFVNSQITPISALNIQEINECDLLVLGGGELIPEWLYIRQSPRFVRGLANRLLRKSSWINKIEIPKIILGCGIDGTTVTGQDVNVLEQFAYIGLRDQKAFTILKSHKQLEDKVHLFYDCAFSANLPISEVKSAKNVAVVIPTDRQNQIASKSIRWLKHNLSSFDKTVFLPFGGDDNNDYKTCQLLSKCTENPEIIPFEKINHKTVINYMLLGDKIFPYRLHGIILAYMLGKPYEYYPYHKKLTRNHETIRTLSPDRIKLEQRREFEAMLSQLLL